MSYQPLTKEQYDQARQQFSHTQITEMEKKRKADMGQAQTEKKGPNVAQQIGQSAVGSLLVRPAVRTGQAIGALGIQAFGTDEMKQRAGEALQQPTEVNMGPLGTYEIPPVKAGTQAARQLTGETLEAASWLYGAPRAAASANVGFMQGLLKSSGFLAKHGAIAGGMFGAGEGLQGEGDVADVLGQTAIGAGAGAAGGAVLGGALPIAPIVASKLAQGSKGLRGVASKAIEKSGDFGEKALGMAKSAGETIGNVPLRMGDRAIEASQKMAQRQATMKAAPPHVRDAMKQGVPDDWIKIATHGNEIDKAVRADMLELAKAGVDVTSKTARPVSKVGEQINQGPVKHLIGVKDEGVTRTKQVLDSLPKEPVPIDNVRNQFIEDMNMAGLVVKDGKFVIQPGGRIPQSDVKFYQEVLDDFSTGKLTYQQMHQLRQKYFDTARSDQMFTDGTTSYAQRMRAFLTKEIDELSGGQYYDAQVQTREAMEALGEYAKLLGYKGNVENLTTKDLKSGETFLRVFGNASDRPNTVLDKVYTNAQKYGYAGQEDIIVQLRFADMLEDVYGSQTRSLGGQVSRATSPTSDPTQTVASGVREMVKWSPYSGAIRLMRASGLIGKRPEDVMRSFENMILTEAGRPMQTQPVSPIREAIKNVRDNLKKTGEDAVDNYMEPPAS
jgi:hypothetical protein